MRNQKFVREHLLAIEKVNSAFFTENHISIMSCVVIIDTNKLTSVHITNELLPEPIRYEIESIFWVN